MVPLMAWLITQYGWRSAAVITGLIMLVVGLPAAYFLRSTPEEKGLLPDGEAVAQAPEGPGEPQLSELEAQSPATDTSTGEIDFTVGEALRTGAFWTYMAAMLLRSCVLGTIVVHQIPYLIDIGIDYQVAAGVLGYMVLMSLPGRLGFGWIGDMFDKRLLLFACGLLQAIGMWIFINASTIGMLYLFVIVYGLGYGGAIPLIHAIRADLFGRKTFATMMGITFAITLLPTVGTPVLLGHLYDVTQNYTIGFYTLMVVSALSGFVFLLIRKPKPPARLSGTSIGS